MLVDFDKVIVENDLKKIRELGDFLDDSSQARAAFMVQSDNFRVWLAEDESRSLLVNGCADLESTESASPLTLVVAKLAKALPASNSAYIIMYFCEYHTGSDDSSEKLLTSLLGQLLAQMMVKNLTFDLSFLEDGDICKIEEHDFRTLNKLFQNFVKQLPPKSLLIITLDEISLYERLPMRKYTQYLVRHLTKLVEKRKMSLASCSLPATDKP